MPQTRCQILVSLCWSSRHRFHESVREAKTCRLSPSSSLSCLDEDEEPPPSSLPPLWICHQPPSLLILRPPFKKSGISFKDAWEEYNSSVAPVLPLTFLKKKKSLNNFVAKDTTSTSNVPLLFSVEFFFFQFCGSYTVSAGNGMDHYLPCGGSANVTGQQRRRSIAFGLQKLEPVCHTQENTEALLTFDSEEVKISTFFLHKSIL